MGLENNSLARLSGSDRFGPREFLQKDTTFAGSLSWFSLKDELGAGHTKPDGERAREQHPLLAPSRVSGSGNDRTNVVRGQSLPPFGRER